MSELADNDKVDQTKRKGYSPRFSLILLIILVLGCPIFYCLIVPATTGQFCLDWVSGHIPKKAEALFLDKLVSGMVAQDYVSLSEISTTVGLMELKELRPTATKNFEVISEDDFAGLYERTIQFDNGARVHLTFHGSWSCPDFIVTEEEVLEKIKLDSIEERE